MPETDERSGGIRNIIVITKNGQPVAQLAPVISRPVTLAGIHKGKIEILGDIVGPLSEPWNAEGFFC